MLVALPEIELVNQREEVSDSTVTCQEHGREMHRKCLKSNDPVRRVHSEKRHVIIKYSEASLLRITENKPLKTHKVKYFFLSTFSDIRIALFERSESLLARPSDKS
jgi:hypothetical protein